MMKEKRNGLVMGIAWMGVVILVGYLESLTENVVIFNYVNLILLGLAVISLRIEKSKGAD